MDGKCKWLEWICSKRGLGLILIVVSLLMIVAILAKPNWLINVLAHILLWGGLFVVIVTGWYYFHCKPFPSKPIESGDKTSIQAWGTSILTILETRRSWLIGFDVAIGTFAASYLKLFMDKRKIKNLNQELAFLGLFIFFFLAFNHGWASWAYVREVKKCPSARFSKEEGVWLLEVTDEVLHRLIRVDVLGLFILVIVIGHLFSLHY